MKTLKKFLSLLLVVVLVVACSSTKTTQTQGKNTTIPIFVTTSYVKDNLDNKDFIFLDARGDEKAETLKGATSIAWKELAFVDGKPGDENWGTMSLDKDFLSKVLSEKGLDMNKEIVIFAATTGAWGEDGRLYWQLNALGYKKLKIVDGGIGAIKGDGLTMQTGATKLEKADVKITDINLDATISTADLEKQIKENKNLKLIDTRSTKEYAGAADFGEAKGGKIPGAINIHFQDLLDENGFLKSNADIEKMLSDKGITKDNDIVTYCTAGIRSAYTQVILSNLGYKAKNYDESFYRWANINDVEK